MLDIKYLSLFSGIGGFELGIQQAYEEYKTQEPVCIGYSEIDKYAIQIYKKHFPKHKNYGDATKIDTSKLPNFNLLVGGFPCQPFSIAGKRKGFDDTRGTLFFEIARILRDKRPRYFLLENVKGLLSHNSGKTFQTILKGLTKMGYFVEWQVLNSKDFGVPQNRERVFIVGHFGEESSPKVFPIRESDGKTDKTKKLSEPISNCLQTNYSNGHSNETYIRQIDKIDKQNNLKQVIGGKSQGQRVYSDKGISQTLAGNAGGQGGKTGLYAISSTQRHRTVMKELSPTLPRAMGEGGGHTPMINTNTKIRRLTPVECERLQGFPDNWTKYGINENGEQVEISDTQRYKTLGNAVTVNVIEAIINHLIKK